jgi:hypothetical protein
MLLLIGLKRACAQGKLGSGLVLKPGGSQTTVFISFDCLDRVQLLEIGHLTHIKNIFAIALSVHL